MAADFYQRKTDDELRFYVSNPSYYAPDLVRAARQELRQRGLLEEVPAAPAYQAPIAEAPAASNKPLLLIGSALLMVGAVLATSFWLERRPAAAPAAAAAAPRPRPRLTEVPTAALPSFDGAVARSVAQQTARLPAAERADPQALRQYRELSRRFWAAETVTEHLLAHPPQDVTLLVAQAGLAADAWAHMRKGLVYSYKNFGPTQAEHLDRMTRAANLQQTELRNLVEAPPTASDEAAKRHAEIQDLLGGLLPSSPVTNRPYRRLVLKSK